MRWAMAALLACLLGLTASVRAEVPLVAWWDMALDAAHPDVLVDHGPLKQNGEIHGARLIADAARGHALAIDGDTQYVSVKGPKANAVHVAFSVTCWVNVQRPAAEGKNMFLVRKGSNAGWQLAMSGGRAFVHGNWGGDWYQQGTGPNGAVPQKQWVHYAMTFQKGDKWRIYINGKEVLAASSPFAIWPSDEEMKIGGTDWAGMLSDVKIYAASLTAEEIQQDMKGTLATRAATNADFPASGYPCWMTLGRYDMPKEFAGFCFRAKQTAVRQPGPDAVDWPVLHMSDGTKLFEKGAEQVYEFTLKEGGKSMSLFRRDDDLTVEPVGLWVRALKWRWGQNYIYTSEQTVRSWSGYYEIWVFPVKITVGGDGKLQSVALKLKGETIYSRQEALNSLTLLVPANPAGEQYELSVNGLPAVGFDAGIKPIQMGKPEYVQITGEVSPSPDVHVVIGAAPEMFPHQKAWDKDIAGLKDAAASLATAAAPVPANPAAPGTSVGTKVFTVEMSAGMSGGHFFSSEQGAGFKGTPEQYAQFLHDVGYDFAIEKINISTLRKGDEAYDKWFIALAQAGVGGMLNVEGYSHEAMLGGPNIAFYAATLPEWRRPLYRDYQLVAEHFAAYPAFGGIFTGADNAGYVPYWDWAPPIPNRPWARALAVAQGTPRPTVPVAKSDGRGKDYERDAKDYRQFLDFIANYDKTWSSYGYFANAIRAIDERLAFTIGSFGSSPGVGAEGGWPWATVPCGPIFSGLPEQTAYDWNEMPSSKPMHNVALVDRLRSSDPAKPTWSIIDEFGLFACREARQRNYALVLTRGVQAVGANFLAHTTAGDVPHEQAIVNDEKELYAWIHRYGGMYAQMKPMATAGIVYVHEQAIGRRATDAKNNYTGSHEGKTTEALFMCHAAGIPAKLITPDELRRGPLDVKVLLLTGLNRFDPSWVWYEGLEKPLADFVAGGGKIIADDESESPVPAIKPPLRIASYITQNMESQAPLLFDRNRDNVAALRQALKDVPLPVAQSDEPTIWAVPSQAGDWQFLTVVNWGYEAGKPADQFVKGQTGKLTWNTDRVIYDVHERKVLTREEASNVDLTHDGFRLYALPPKPMDAEQIEQALTANPPTAEPARPTYAGLPMARLWAASPRPLVLALTPEQSANEAVMALAKRVQAVASKHGRDAAIRSIARGDVVVSLQPQESIMHYPQWATIDADLVLLGSSADNILILDQARGGLLPAGQKQVVTGSPFVGEQLVLNLIGANAAELEMAVQALEKGKAR